MLISRQSRAVAFGLASGPGAYQHGPVVDRTLVGRAPASAAPEVLDVVDLPDPTSAEGQQVYEVSAAGINYADSHHPVSAN
jgi:hypothetical protein